MGGVRNCNKILICHFRTPPATVLMARASKEIIIIFVVFVCSARVNIELST